MQCTFEPIQLANGDASIFLASVDSNRHCREPSGTSPSPWRKRDVPPVIGAEFGMEVIWNPLEFGAAADADAPPAAAANKIRRRSDAKFIISGIF